MEDFNEPISSTTPTIDELERRQGSEYGMGDANKLFDDAASYLLDNKEPVTSYPTEEDDILDLAGGARDAIERHKATLPRFEDPPRYTYSEFDTSDPEPSASKPGAERGAAGFVDSTQKQTKPVDEIADTETPKPEPRIPAKSSYSPGTSSPYEPIFSSSAPSQPLMQSSAEGRIQPLGQESDSSRRGIVAPVSPLSPLHSPDSLEELSLSDSPNQAPFISEPFGSCPRPRTEAFSQKLVHDVPLGEEEKLFECKTWADNPNLKSGLDIDYRERSREPNKEGLKAATYSHIASSQLSSSVITTEIDLGSKVDPAQSMFGEDSGVASSPDEKLGSSVGSQEDERTDSDKEGSDKDSGSGESTGSTPTRSPVNPNLATEPYVTCAPSNPTAKSEAPYLFSRDNVKATDAASDGLFSSKTSWYETETLTSKAKAEVDDDSFLLETKMAAPTKNPFQGFSPIGHSGSGFSQYREMGSDSRAVKMSESPTPDLVQYAHDDAQDAPPAKHKEETHFDLVQMGSDSVKEPSVPSVPPSKSPKESEDSPVQSSLPDILESSPLSPGKLDSDLSEGSPDSEQSPIQEIRMETRYAPVAHSATNPFAFNSDPKISVPKDTPADTGARGAKMAEHAALPGLDKTFGGFDLVKEVDRYESVPYMNLPMSAASKAAPEESDSDSLNTDSLSPVLEAIAKDPASFEAELERNVKDYKVPPAKDLPGSRMFSEDPEASEEEGFEQEVSSEEFEIIERPPKGAIDEFVEKLDRSKFATAPEIDDDDDDDDDILGNLRPEKAVPDVGSEFQKAGSQQSSYTLLAQPSSVASPQMFGAELGNPFASTHQVKEAASVSPAPLSHFAGEASETFAPGQKTVESVGPCETALTDVSKASGSPALSVEAVVDLLYWRDLKKTGVVFGVSLFLLLSLTVCSIVSICSYAALALLSVTIVFRIYKGILQAVQKSEEGHPFKAQLDQDVALSEDTVHKYSDMALARTNCALKELRRLFLVEDLVDSLKFAVLMWILTYVGALFNGLTLLILGLISAFSMPIVYEKYQTQIDHYYGLFHSQVKDVVGKIQDKVPGLKRKAE